MPLRVGLLLDHPSPHMVALLDALGRREDCTVQVVYCGQSAPGRRWGAPAGSLPYTFSSGTTLPVGLKLNPCLVRSLNGVAANVWIVNIGYTSPSALLAVWWLRKSGIPWVYMGEPPRLRGRVLETLKAPLLEFVLRHADGVVGTGKAAEAIFEKWIGATKPTASVPYYVDLEDFLSLPPPPAPREDVAVEFITASQMVQRKGLDILLSACELLPESGWRLTLAGTGRLRRKHETGFGKRWQRERVRFIGESLMRNVLPCFPGSTCLSSHLVGMVGAWLCRRRWQLAFRSSPRPGHFSP